MPHTCSDGLAIMRPSPRPPQSLTEWTPTVSGVCAHNTAESLINKRQTQKPKSEAHNCPPILAR